MMLTVKRIQKGENSTLSEIYLDGRRVCYGLEDTVRDVKIKGSTAIPAGKYRLALNIYGGMNARYKRDYPAIHRGMIQIMNVPNYSHVYIHVGNNFSHTAGCLLVGTSFVYDDKDYILSKSAKAYKMLYELVIEAVAKGKAEIMING